MLPISAVKLCLGVFLTVVFLCSGFVYFLVLSDSLYRREQRQLLVIGKSTLGMSRTQAFETLRAKQRNWPFEVQTKGKDIVIISNHEYTFFADGVARAAVWIQLDNGRVASADITFVGHD